MGGGVAGLSGLSSLEGKRRPNAPKLLSAAFVLERSMGRKLSQRKVPWNTHVVWELIRSQLATRDYEATRFLRPCNGVPSGTRPLQ